MIWKDVIGNGDGSFFMPATSQAEVGYYNAFVRRVINDTLDNETAPSATAEMAASQGLIENISQNQFKILARIKEAVMRIDTHDYVFDRRIFYHPTLSPTDALAEFLAGNYATFLSECTEITGVSTDDRNFLNMLL